MIIILIRRDGVLLYKYKLIFITLVFFLSIIIKRYTNIKSENNAKNEKQKKWRKIKEVSSILRHPCSLKMWLVKTKTSKLLLDYFSRSYAIFCFDCKIVGIWFQVPPFKNKIVFDLLPFDFVRRSRQFDQNYQKR